jgi:hypothetical protein
LVLAKLSVGAATIVERHQLPSADDRPCRQSGAGEVNTRDRVVLSKGLYGLGTKPLGVAQSLLGVARARGTLARDRGKRLQDLSQRASGRWRENFPVGSMTWGCSPRAICSMKSARVLAGYIDKDGFGSPRKKFG